MIQLYKEDKIWLSVIGVILFFSLIFIIIAYNWGHSSGFEEQLDSIGILETAINKGFIRIDNHTERKAGVILSECSTYLPKFSLIKNKEGKYVQSDYWKVLNCKRVNYTAIKTKESDRDYIKSICNQIRFNVTGKTYRYNGTNYNGTNFQFNGTYFNQSFCTPNSQSDFEEFGFLNLNIYEDNGSYWNKIMIK